ncbi:hypothetical protein GJ744_007912 [Endocarpon pusillum]|uniref:MATE efflux family protein n=1 Tax=Endocarpon pusillum TaxID=364733 RepID=A0A8H7AM91_9EURO|nr:hypothetical protein GJ744_007912 [Endocarpon pusillum]
MASQVSENTPLLPETGYSQAAASRLPDHTIKDEESGSKWLNAGFGTTRTAEAKLLAWNGAPLMLTSVLQNSFNVTTAIVAGHLGSSELAALALATMTTNVTGLAVYEGLATSLDTLCSQAYGGRNEKMVGLHMQRMIYFLWLVTIPIGAVWLCSPWILGAIVPEKDVAILAGSYLRIYLIGAPGFATFEAGKRFVQAQGIFTPSLLVLLVTAPLNILLNWIFVWKLGWALQGAAAAISTTNLVQPILLLLYVRFAIPHSLQCWPGFSWNAFKNWGPMVRLAVPGILTVEAEWLAWDILTFSSAHLGKTYLAAQSVLYNTSVLMYHLPMPASIAASTRIGNLIGSGALDAARVAVTAYYFVFSGIGLFNLSFLVAMKDVIPRIFSNDLDVRNVVSLVMPICAAFQLVDSTTSLCNGLLRGLGIQYIGAWANLVVYYGFSIPVSLYLTFGPPHLGLWGLWIGPAAGLAAVTIIDSIFIKRISWKKCVEEARRRSE